MVLLWKELCQATPLSFNAVVLEYLPQCTTNLEQVR